ncbi:MAG TPA: sodium transporter, partial [Sutterella sp.]|nr:sodium transporter [Sutterella sp.]
TKSVSAYLPAFSSIVIAVVVAIVVSHSAARLLSGGLIVIAAVVLHNLAGLAVGYAIARAFGMNMRKCAALSIEVGMQNSGLASALAVVHFSAFPLASVPGAIFSVWHNLSGALIAKVYAARSERLDG